MSELADYSTPIDAIEPEPDEGDGYRLAARTFARVMDQALWFIASARDPKLAALQVSFAVGASVTDGKSMNHFGEVMGYTRAAISKGAKSFQRANNIKPIRGTQKDEEACQKYSETRLAQLQDQ